MGWREKKSQLFVGWNWISTIDEPSFVSFLTLRWKAYMIKTAYERLKLAEGFRRESHVILCNAVLALRLSSNGHIFSALVWHSKCRISRVSVQSQTKRIISIESQSSKFWPYVCFFK